MKKLFVACLLCMVIAVDAASSPVSMLESTAQQLTNRLDSQQNLTTPYVKRTIRQVVLPVFDVNVMARSVVGKRHWTAASDVEKSQFRSQFTDQVIQVYSAPLKEYDGDKIKFYPLRGGIPSHNRVVVNSRIIRSNGQQIPVSYRLVLTGGQWKVYDFSVEGISMIESYRSQYRPTLQQGGLAALIRKM